MVSPGDITGFINNKWFDSIAGAGKWVVYLMISIFLLVLFWFLMRYMEHKKKVTYFQVYGGDTQKLKAAAADGIITAEEMKTLGIQLGHPKFAKLKDIKQSGVRKCSLIVTAEKGTVFKPKIIKDIPFQLRYPDGIWMLRLSADNFVPIERPKVGSGIILNMSEPDMDLWEESARAEIRNRTQDDDAQKRALTMTVVIIIGAFVLAGLIIWLSMSFAGKSINDVLIKVEPMTSALTTLAKGTAPG
jgi:hypothetical protein